MAIANQPNEVPRTGFKKSRSMLLLSGTSLASVESLSLPLVQEVVILADVQCAECHKRVADIMSRMNGTDSVSFDVREKKVVITCRYPGVKVSARQVAAVYRNPRGKIAIIKRIFRSYCS